MSPKALARSRCAAVFAVAVMAWLAPPVEGQLTTRVSLAHDGSEANRACTKGVLSADGRHVAFISEATNLVPGDTNQIPDIFVRDLDTGVTERVSVSTAGAEANAASLNPHISADGSIVAFTSSASNLVAHDTNGARDVFVRDRIAGRTDCISVSPEGIPGLQESACSDLSEDGDTVVFTSKAQNLVPNDFGGDQDVFVRDRALGLTEMVSVATGGWQGNCDSADASVSADGQVVAFTSQSTNLAPDTNGGCPTGHNDDFVRDRPAGTTTLISVDNLGQQVNGYSIAPDISADGRFVAFTCVLPLLGEGGPNTGLRVYVRDLLAGTTELQSLDSNGALLLDSFQAPAISSDGRFITLNTLLGALPSRVRDRVAGTTQLLAIGTHGEVSNHGSLAEEQPFSTDGRYVVFTSSANNLVPDDTNNASDIFLRDTRPFFSDLGQGLAGTAGVPSLTGSGVLLPGEPVAIALASARPSAPSALFVSPFNVSVPFKGGTLVPAATIVIVLATGAGGAASLSASWPAGLPSDLAINFQWWIQDPAGPVGFAASNAIVATTP